jgi:uncharacterized glyoxalase superfamily protein PhnB
MSAKTKTFLFIPALLIGLALAWGIIGQLTINKNQSENQNENRMLTKLTINLIVADVNESIKFYKEVLGFTVTAKVPDKGNFDFAILNYNEIELMLNSQSVVEKEMPDVYPKKIGGTVAFFYEVEDAEILYAKVKPHCEIVKEMHETFYGTREFYFRDLDGYVIGFAQKLVDN